MYLKPSIQNINSINNLNKIDSTAILILQNGKFFKGLGLGYQGTATGEVCFNTSITGYQEIISDPSYAEQIINFTFPHVGFGSHPSQGAKHTTRNLVNAHWKNTGCAG